MSQVTVINQTNDFDDYEGTETEIFEVYNCDIVNDDINFMSDQYSKVFADRDDALEYANFLHTKYHTEDIVEF